MGLDWAVLFALATSGRWERAVRSLPGGEKRAWRATSRYVAGPSVDDAVRATTGLLARGDGGAVDLFGELVRDPEGADRTVEEYRAGADWFRYWMRRGAESRGA